MALSSDRNTYRRSGEKFNHPVAAGVKIYAGALVCLNASGYAVPGSTSATLKTVGRAEERVDNSSGSNGAEYIDVETGTYLFKNDGSITRPDIKSSAYIVDDETVADNDGGGSRSLAGQIVDIDPDTNQVWVSIS